MLRKFAGVSVFMLFSPGAFAAADGGYVDVFYVPSAKIEVTVPGFGSGDDDGDGFGFKGLATFETLGITGEFQSVSYDDSGIDNEQLRLGAGLVGPTTSGVFLEYVDIELDGASADGFGLQGRLAGEHFHMQAGYVSIKDDYETMAGVEFLVGFAIGDPQGYGAFVDLRRSMLEGEDSEVEYEFTDIRAGLRVRF
jgi:hypothetical protein